MDIQLFNDIAIGTVFHHPKDCNMKFIKFANANSNKAPHNQAPNCLNLCNNHYFSLGAKSPVIVDKEPVDYDDTKLLIE